MRRPIHRRKKFYTYDPAQKVIFHYGRRPFIMSPVEHDLYRILLGIVGDSYYVFPQMQLSSIFSSNPHQRNFMDALRHINQKSVDYVVCEKDSTAPVLVIELDGWSHRLKYRQRRDAEVNRIAEEAGVHIIHLTNLEDMTYESLRARILAFLPKVTPTEEISQ